MESVTYSKRIMASVIMANETESEFGLVWKIYEGWEVIILRKCKETHQKKNLGGGNS